MKKKIVIINIILVFLLQILYPLVYAIENEQLIASGQCGENLEWRITEDGHFTISGLGKMNDFESVSDTPWNSYRSSIMSITISDGIENIGKNAFYYYFPNVTNLEIGNDVKTIGEYAFYNCKNLENIIIPNSVINIGGYAFGNCTNVTNLDLGNGVKTIGEHAFYSCKNLKNIIIPDSVTKIGNSAFCLPGAEVEYIKLSKNISEMGSFQFKILGKTIYNGTLDEWANINFHGQQANPIYYSHNLYNEDGEIINVKLNSTKTLGYAFCNWSALESIELAEGTTEIPLDAFRNCQNLESIIIPDSVNLIGESAFSSCTSLKNITLPNEINIIPSHLFYNCTSLESIIIPKNVTEISRYSFYNCSSLKEIVFNDNNLSKIGEYAFAYSGIENITFPNCTTIENDVFINCKNLKNVTLPNNLEKISKYMLANSGLEYVVVPNTITEIGDYAFSDCKSLKFVAIAPSVETIGEYSFDGCGEYIDLENGWKQYIKGSFIIKGEKGSYAETYANSTNGRYAFEEHYNCLKSVIEPTCISEGKKTYECLYCKQISNEVVDKAEHNWSDTYTIDREATCAEKGEKSIHCTVCDEKKENSEIELELKEHIWDEGQIIKNPTNTEKGIKQYKCINCDATKQEEIDILKYKISGEIKSFLNENDIINIKLMNHDSSSTIYENDFVGNNVSYSIDEVPAGTYILHIEKANHISKGYSIIINNESIIQNIKIFPLGDINEDGKVNGKDWNRLYEHINETKLLTEDEFNRADINDDGKVNGKDWNRLYDHINETNPLW